MLPHYGESFSRENRADPTTKSCSSDAKPSLPTRKSPMRIALLTRGRAALFAGICIVALLSPLVALLGPAIPAANAQSIRSQIPIMAGTALDVPGTRRCTAGAVLRSRSWISLATPFRRATRYVVLVKHCTDLGNPIKVGGEVVGSVSWASSNYDLALATIPPSTVQRPICFGASQLHHCTIPAATPRAVGRIILHDGSTQRDVAIPGIGVPAVGERFCTSGAVSLVNCGFRYVDVPSRGWDPGAAAARTFNGRNVILGDSGGPVASVGGRLYGIIISRGKLELGFLAMLAYVPMFVVFQDLGYTYELAPA